MNEERFDELAKAAAHGVSRRRLLVGLAGAAVGLGVRDGGEAAAQTNVEVCEQSGGQVVAQYGACHAHDAHLGMRCGDFQYLWVNRCHIPGRDDAPRSAGCGLCLR
jgi:hypothetical protein